MHLIPFPVFLILFALSHILFAHPLGDTNPQNDAHDDLYPLGFDHYVNTLETMRTQYRVGGRILNSIDTTIQDDEGEQPYNDEFAKLKGVFEEISWLSEALVGTSFEDGKARIVYWANRGEYNVKLTRSYYWGKEMDRVSYWDDIDECLECINSVVGHMQYQLGHGNDVELDQGQIEGDCW